MKYSDGCETYQYDYSSLNKDVLNTKKRKLKALKIKRILEDFTCKQGLSLSNMKGLDVGCSGGFNTATLAQTCEQMIGIDIDEQALIFARENHGNVNCLFRIDDCLNMSFPDHTFDFVICNHIYEHVSNPQKLLNEIYRVLKPNGICYFAAINRFSFMEPHYNLPFLSWLPKRYANIYLTLTGKGNYYYEKPSSLKKLEKLVVPFKVIDYTSFIINNLHTFEPNILNTILAKVMPHYLIKILLPLVPTYIWILQKR